MKLITKSELFLLEEIVKKNFAAKYKDSVLGIFWSVLKPLLLMLILTIAFSTLFTRNIANYPVYILSGKCVFDFFIGAVGLSMNSIKGNQNILQKTAAPKHIFIIGSIISEFINFLITLGILVGVMIATHAPFYFIVMPVAIIPVIAEIFIITGIGLALSIVRVYYTDMQHLWSVITQLLFYATAIFYPMDIIPLKFRKILVLDPIYWFVDQFRCVVIDGAIPDLLYMINLLLISLIILTFGIIVFKKYENKVTMRF